MTLTKRDIYWIIEYKFLFYFHNYQDAAIDSPKFSRYNTFAVKSCFTERGGVCYVKLARGV
ncbi:hypothetical protein D5281_10900 [bacterium 1xD42-62]|uniref:Uncharacterized protein n=1 Tax=Parablautia muri TaxID=2320879 RepID=A0A9X5BGA4_9FIRM|nr:hypothetical protein [Parablautia muri]